MKRRNFILMSDSYKVGGHWNMLPEGTTHVWSYGECRTGAQYPKSVWTGLQPIIKKHFTGRVVEQWMLDEAKPVIEAHLGDKAAMHIEGWQLIIDDFDGYLPLHIMAAPEGLIIPVSNILFGLVNTDERFAWLTNEVESILMKFWYPTAVATRSYYIVGGIKHYADASSDVPDVWKFLLHDFGYRSATCEEQAEVGGAAILVNTLGTDTVPALKYAVEYYGRDGGAAYDGLGFSVPATEHSIATSYGPGEGEFVYLRTMMERYPNGILSIVGDTYGIENFVNVVVAGCKDEILARYENSVGPMPGRVVVRPDSPRWEDDRPEDQCLWIYDRLADMFGTTLNSKGKRVLHPAVGVLYGDGLSEEEIAAIYAKLFNAGYSVENMVVGQGGGLMQRIDRDTMRVAVKSSAQKRNGRWFDTQKNPSDITKASKAGRMALIKVDGEYKTVRESERGEHPNILRTVFHNGEAENEITFDELRCNTGRW